MTLRREAERGVQYLRRGLSTLPGNSFARGRSLLFNCPHTLPPASIKGHINNCIYKLAYCQIKLGVYTKALREPQIRRHTFTWRSSAHGSLLITRLWDGVPSVLLPSIAIMSRFFVLQPVGAHIQVRYLLGWFRANGQSSRERICS